ncbi:hypothetical protein H920_01106 [Fukomys damarensis]|uniref:Uncharacterized protein n=1 Tax=Fukomys damarensis TaxID=885580 RepID=A0A091E2C1_FUKDA|nr:hypothetical protein H920_01106 [Fukomys damarensis]
MPPPYSKLPRRSKAYAMMPEGCLGTSALDMAQLQTSILVLRWDFPQSTPFLSHGDTCVYVLAHHRDRSVEGQHPVSLRHLAVWTATTLDA